MTKKHKPFGLKQNKAIAKKSGHVAKVAREDMEKELGETVISKGNALNYEYINESEILQNKDKRELNDKK